MAKAPNKVSIKHVQISKANTVVSITLAVASFLTIFSLVASKSMLEQRSYNNKVITQKEKARDILEANIDAVATLETSYRAFVAEPTNIIGGESQGSGDRAGDNATIILDALPSKYDFPAVATSIEKILSSNSALTINEIDGTDDEVAQAAFDSDTPQVVEIPFNFSVDGDYSSLLDTVQLLERSIRPIKIDKLTLSASGDDAVSLEVEALTYYQSAKTFNVTTKVVKP